MPVSAGSIRLAAGRKWLAAVAAALLGFSVSVGGFAWYTGALALDRDDMAALIPPSREVPPCSVISSAFASCRAAYTDARIIEQ